jgi:NAD(P)-dependent dehydrogenase (short-subunit alcohol dehydrogenase family)
VSQFEQVHTAADAVEREFSRIVLWINNAMLSMYNPFLKMTPDEFRHIVEVTFLDQLYGMHCVLKQMMKLERGVII